MAFVLTNRFNNDVVEEYFGRQRSLGRRSDNPNIWQFGFNDNIIRTRRSVTPVTGNTEGRHDKKRKVSSTDVDETRLKKKQKNQKGLEVHDKLQIVLPFHFYWSWSIVL